MDGRKAPVELPGRGEELRFRRPQVSEPVPNPFRTSTACDPSSKGNAEALLRIERDLAVSLRSTNNLQEALDLILSALTGIQPIDSGVVYLVDRTSGLHLEAYCGLSQWFIERVSRFQVDDPQTKIVMSGSPTYCCTPKELFDCEDLFHKEGLCSLAVIPVRFRGEVVAALSLASHTHPDIPEATRNALEAIAAQIGGIVARIRSEEALKRSEERYRMLFSGASDALFVMGLASNGLPGRYREVNDVACSKLGYTREELLKLSPTQLESPECVPTLPERMEQLHRDGQILFETVLIAKDRRRIPFEVSVHLFRLSGEPIIISAKRDISERKLVEQALKISEEQYRNIFEHAPVGIFQSTPEGELLRCNPAFSRIFGYETLAALLAESACPVDKLYLHSGEREAFLEELFTHDSWITGEREFFRKDGAILNVRITARLVSDSTKRSRYIEGFIEDVTQRRLAEKTLEESERRYRTIFEESMDAIYITDRLGNFLDANRATLEMFGYSREEILGTSTHSLYANELERERLREELKRNGSVRDFELKLQKSDGSCMDCIVSVTKWQAEIDSAPGYLGIVRDVTKKRQAERALKESETRYQAIVEDQTELICRFTPDGKLTFANEAYCRCFGKRREDLLGASFILPILEEDRDKVLEHLDLLVKGAPALACEHRVILPNGDIRWQQWSDRTILGESGEIVEFQSVGRDITEQKRFEEALRQANDNLEKRVEERTFELKQKTVALEEMNTALKVLLKQREADREELEESILANAKGVISPYIEKLKRAHLTKDQTTLLSIIESHIEEITSPFLRKLSSKYLDLTPAEIEVAEFIKEGRTTKEISDLLHLSENTVLTHRYHLRRKLGLNNNRINLRTYLKSLES